MKITRAAWLILASALAVGCATPAVRPCEPATVQTVDTQPPAKPPDPAVAAGKLRCARARMGTMAIAASAHLPLEKMAAEGGAADVYVREELMRIDVGLLGESVREHGQLLFAKGKLVCSELTTTSILTVMEQTKKNPQGRPPFWRYDFRVFADGKAIHHLHDEAPGRDYQARDAAQTSALAEELRKVAQAKLAAKP